MALGEAEGVVGRGAEGWIRFWLQSGRGFDRAETRRELELVNVARLEALYLSRAFMCVPLQLRDQSLLTRIGSLRFDFGIFTGFWLTGRCDVHEL